VTTSYSVDQLRGQFDWTAGVSYTQSVDGNGVLQQERWYWKASSLNVMTIDWTYNVDGSIATARKKAYDADGTTVISQLLMTWSYAGNVASWDCTREI